MNFTKTNIITAFILLALLTSCKKEEKKVIVDKDAKFIKEWESRKTIVPGTSFIKIKPDHTFEYNSAGCQWRSNSFGKWTVKNDTLILNSIPSKKCQFTNGFGNNMRMPKKGEEFEQQITIKGCKPNERDGDYANFINDKFYIKNDTLEYVTDFKFQFGDRIAFFVK